MSYASSGTDRHIDRSLRPKRQANQIHNFAEFIGNPLSSCPSQAFSQRSAQVMYKFVDRPGPIWVGEYITPGLNMSRYSVQYFCDDDAPCKTGEIPGYFPDRAARQTSSTRCSKPIPTAAAALGTRLVLVIPGIVFISRQL